MTTLLASFLANVETIAPKMFTFLHGSEARRELEALMSGDRRDPTALVSVVYGDKVVKQPLVEEMELLGEGEPILFVIVERKD